MSEETRLIPLHGNYRELLSYRKAEIVYDVTFEFCDRFLAKERLNDRSDDPGRAFGQTEHSGRQ
jgi:hypothetical protein